MKWEYEVTPHGHDKEHLNEMGAQGWELIAVQHNSTIWKRPLDEAVPTVIDPDATRKVGPQEHPIFQQKRGENCPTCGCAPEDWA